MTQEDHARLRAVTTALLSSFDLIAKKMALTEQQYLLALSWAALEGTGRRVGVERAIEHLRSAADVAEEELLEQCPRPWKGADFKPN